MTLAMDPVFVDTREAAGSCPKCRYLLPRLVECAPTYFKLGSVLCTHCGEKVELWQAALGKAIALAPTGWALGSLGAAQTSVVMPMESGKTYQIQLTDHGAPPGARILSTNYTGQTGNLTAIEWHGNVPLRRSLGTVLHLLAVPFGEGPLPREGRVAISIVWIRGDDSDAWPYLVTAFEAAAAQDYAPSIIFAQSAVEISMMPVIEKRFRLHAPRKKVRRFTNYSRALNVVLPYLCGEAGIAQMPVTVLEALDKLRDRRNKIIHEGVKEAAITSKNAMEGLCAAAFGFEYIRYVEPLLSRKKE